MKRFLALIFAYLLIFPPGVLAAITHDADNGGDGVDTDTVTYAHTVGGGCTNTIIVVSIRGRLSGASTFSSVSIGGSAGTLIDSQTAGGSQQSHLYYRKGVSTGSNTITVVYAAANDRWRVSSHSYCGVNQTTAIGTAAKTSGTGTTPSVDVSSATGELVVDSMSHRDDDVNSCSVGASQTQRDLHHVNFFTTNGFSEEAGAGTVTMSWSCVDSNVWAIVGVPLKPAADNPKRASAIIVE